MDMPIINLGLTEYTSIYEIILGVSCLLSAVMAIFCCLIMLIGSMFKVRSAVLLAYMLTVMMIFTVIFFYLVNEIYSDLRCNPWDPRCKTEWKTDVPCLLLQGTSSYTS